jgi:predicted P-loop ATPase
MQHHDDFISQWELILADVNKTDVPLECIKKVVIKLAGGKQKTINIHTLLKQGLDLEEVETMLTRYFGENDNQIRDVDFVIDVSAVANLVQPETDKILTKLK